jgi:hypothetical protein
LSRLSSICAGLCDRQGSAIPQAARTSVSCVSLRRDRCSLGNTKVVPRGAPTHCESSVRRPAKAERSNCASSLQLPSGSKPHPLGCGTRPSGRTGAPLAGRHVDDRSRLPQAVRLVRNAGGSTWFETPKVLIASAAAHTSSLLEQADGTAFGLAKRHGPSGRPCGASLDGMHRRNPPGMTPSDLSNDPRRIEIFAIASS